MKEDEKDRAMYMKFWGRQHPFCETPVSRQRKRGTAVTGTTPTRSSPKGERGRFTAGGPPLEVRLIWFEKYPSERTGLWFGVNKSPVSLALIFL